MKKNALVFIKTPELTYSEAIQTYKSCISENIQIRLIPKYIGAMKSAMLMKFFVEREWRKLQNLTAQSFEIVSYNELGFVQLDNSDLLECPSMQKFWLLVQQNRQIELLSIYDYLNVGGKYITENLTFRDIDEIVMTFAEQDRAFLKKKETPQYETAFYEIL